MSDALFGKTWSDENSKEPISTNNLKEKSPSYDFVIIGGGLAGLVASLELSKAGASVAILEANTIGSGASGRNGGFCSKGWATSHKKIRKLLGSEVAKNLDYVASEGYEWMRERVSRQLYREADAKFGEINLSLEKLKISNETGVLGRDDLKQYIHGPRYKSGRINQSAFQFNPLNFLRILMEECLCSGVHIFEGSPAIGITTSDNKDIFTIHTTHNIFLNAINIVYATGGYGGSLNPKLSKILLAIKTFIAVSAPIPLLLDKYVPSKFMIADSRRAGNYFRRLHDGRLLWGMGISAFGDKSIARIKTDAFNDLTAHLPDLANEMTKAGVQFEYGWSGNMAYGRDYLPYVGLISRNQYALTGFGGHGMNTAPGSAICLSNHLLGLSSQMESFIKIKRKRVYGLIGKIAAETVYKTLNIRDLISEYKN